ncbi:MAG: hypothetical protein WC460_01150 [Patescibacteria group bacterium]
MKKFIIAQFIILLGGTIFAWTNFTIELIDYLNQRACSTGCAIGVVNPVYTPCFYGAIFFTLAFVLSAIMLKKSRVLTLN